MALLLFTHIALRLQSSVAASTVSLFFMIRNFEKLNFKWHVLYRCGLQPLLLVGQKYLLTGEVHIDSALYDAAHLLGDSLVIKVKSSDGLLLDLDNPARLISELNDVNSYAVYEYSHWAKLGEQLTFSAHHERCDLAVSC